MTRTTIGSRSAPETAKEEASEVNVVGGKIGWSKLKNHNGSSRHVPLWVRQLDEGSEQAPLAELSDALVREGQYCPATAPTMRLLFQRIGEASKPGLHLSLLAQLVGATARLRPRVLMPPPEDVRAVMVENQELLWGSMGASNPDERSAAATLAAMVPSELLERAREVLVAQAAQDPDPIVRASATLALHRFEGEQVKSLLLAIAKRDNEAVVQGAAALSYIWQSAGTDLAAVGQQLLSWLGWEGGADAPEDADLYWFGIRQTHVVWGEALIDGLRPTAGALVNIGRELGVLDEWGPSLLKLLQDVRSPRECLAGSQVLQTCYHLIGDDSWWQVEEVKTLSSAQVELARICMDGPLLFQSGHGFPAAGLIRRRWLQMAEPGPMDARVQYGGVEQPLWKCFVLHRRFGWDLPLPDLSSLRPEQRWEVMVLYSAGFYHPLGNRILSEELEDELRIIGTCSELAHVGPPIVDEVLLFLQRLRAIDATNEWEHPENVALLLVPLCRAGVVLKFEWLTLLPSDLELGELGREIVEAMAPEEREGWLWENEPMDSDAIHFFDLYPSSRLFERTLVGIAEARRDGTELSQVSFDLENKVKDFARSNAMARVGLAHANQRISSGS